MLLQCYSYQVSGSFSVDDYSHYLFTPRDLTRWALGLLRYTLPEEDSSLQPLLQVIIPYTLQQPLLQVTIPYTLLLIIIILNINPLSHDLFTRIFKILVLFLRKFVSICERKGLTLIMVDR